MTIRLLGSCLLTKESIRVAAGQSVGVPPLRVPASDCPQRSPYIMIRTATLGYQFVGRRAARAIIYIALAFAPSLAPATDVPKWSTYDIKLTASGDSMNWYTDPNAAVTAIFSGPGGATKTVTGFWNGNNTFDIRFTPTIEGTWTYTTSSGNSGLDNQSGAINAIAALPNNHGFLRIDAAHPNSFVYDDGTRNFLWGQTYYDLMQDAMVNDNWQTAIDNSLAYGMNKIRLRVYAQGGFYGFDNVDHGYPDVVPYAGTAASPDRDSLNFAYLQKLDQVVRYLDSKGVTADLILLSTYGNSTMPGTTTQDQRFAKYITSRYSAYENVIWDLTNEWADGGKTQSYFNAIGDLVRSNDPWLTQGEQLRPLSIHQNTGIDFRYFGTSWPTHAIIQYGPRNNDGYTTGDDWGNAGIVRNLGHNVPVVNDEYGYINDGGVGMTQAKSRQAIWGIATAGGYGSMGDIRMFGSGATQWTPCKTGEWADAPGEYGDIKRMVDFFTTKNIEYWKMSSQNSLLNFGLRTYVLAETGAQYVVYAAEGGTFSLNLAAGTYEARLYDPQTGGDARIGTVVSSGHRPWRYTMPNTDDWVVYLVKAPEPATLSLLGAGCVALAIYQWRRKFCPRRH